MLLLLLLFLLVLFGQERRDFWKRKEVVASFVGILCEDISHRRKTAHSKYHLLKSYDYDIIYSPVFVAIYVANRRKFVLT